MDAGRTANPLAAGLRVVFVAVVAVGALVDLWLLGGTRSQSSLSVLAGIADIGRTWSLALAGIAIAGAVWARWPGTVVFAGLAASGLSLLATANAPRHGLRFGLFTECVVLPVLFGAVLAGSSRWRGWVGAAIVIAAEALPLRADDSPVRAILAISMFVLLGTAAVAVAYMRIRDRERSTSIERARQDERLDLARELHDVVGHHVTGIVVLAQASRFTSANGAAGDPEATDRAFAAIEQAGQETLHSIRRLVGLLRTEVVVTAPPRLAGIEQLVVELRSTHPMAVLIADERIRTMWLPDDLAFTVHRLVQEASTNVRKHGDPHQPVTFSLRSTGVIVDLVVDNVSLHAANGDGFGITGMRERVDALGGTFRAGAEGARWVLRVVLPVGVPVG
ncbi:MAG: histidine kinase [Ilumatobacteraceae bacterium]|nr:histidine kinase [Ilumatobacteraceae bacterium]